MSNKERLEHERNWLVSVLTQPISDRDRLQVEEELSIINVVLKAA